MNNENDLIEYKNLIKKIFEERLNSSLDETDTFVLYCRKKFPIKETIKRSSFYIQYIKNNKHNKNYNELENSFFNTYSIIDDNEFKKDILLMWLNRLDLKKFFEEFYMLNPKFVNPELNQLFQLGIFEPYLINEELNSKIEKEIMQNLSKNTRYQLQNFSLFITSGFHLNAFIIETLVNSSPILLDKSHVLKNEENKSIIMCRKLNNSLKKKDIISKKQKI